MRYIVKVGVEVDVEVWKGRDREVGCCPDEGWFIDGRIYIDDTEASRALLGGGITLALFGLVCGILVIYVLKLCAQRLRLWWRAKRHGIDRNPSDLDINGSVRSR